MFAHRGHLVQREDAFCCRLEATQNAEWSIQAQRRAAILMSWRLAPPLWRFSGLTPNVEQVLKTGTQPQGHLDLGHFGPIQPPFSPTCPLLRSKWSKTTDAIIASPTGTARMPTHGSWRPLVTISVSSPVRVIVFRGVRIDEVGLTANRTTMSCPVEIPPRIPPAWFEP